MTNIKIGISLNDNPEGTKKIIKGLVMVINNAFSIETIKILKNPIPEDYIDDTAKNTLKKELLDLLEEAKKDIESRDYERIIKSGEKIKNHFEYTTKIFEQNDQLSQYLEIKEINQTYSGWGKEGLEKLLEGKKDYYERLLFNIKIGTGYLDPRIHNANTIVAGFYNNLLKTGYEIRDILKAIENLSPEKKQKSVKTSDNFENNALSIPNESLKKSQKTYETFYAGIKICRENGREWLTKNGKTLKYSDGIERKHYHIRENIPKEGNTEIPLFCVQDISKTVYFVFVNKNGQLQKINNGVFYGDIGKFYYGIADIIGDGNNTLSLTVSSEEIIINKKNNNKENINYIPNCIPIEPSEIKNALIILEKININEIENLEDIFKEINKILNYFKMDFHLEKLNKLKELSQIKGNDEDFLIQLKSRVDRIINSLKNILLPK
ncbi:hypothetical protein HGA92_02170 [Candidatus Gracilibacteria bacterium]|nr:hypothetical protein [Candidatus Gracilibacteria bacterium]NUJ99417.1 hypothetical protein [Candidatus Gracilibacteria bacterium]